jgi:hypothetical protein
VHHQVADEVVDKIAQASLLSSDGKNLAYLTEQAASSR